MVILYLRCLEVDVQGLIQSAEKKTISSTFSQVLKMDLDHFLARFVSIL
jgi:hypothetical protein